MVNPSALSSFPRLRLFTDSHVQPPVAKELAKICQVWEQQVAPDLFPDTAQKPLEGYLDAISHWEALMHDAPAHRLSRELLREFQHKLLRGKHSRKKSRSAATVNKILRTMRPIVARWTCRRTRGRSRSRSCSARGRSTR